MADERGGAPPVERRSLSWTWVLIIVVGVLLVFWLLSPFSGTDEHPGAPDDRLEQKEPPSETRPRE